MFNSKYTSKISEEHFSKLIAYIFSDEKIAQSQEHFKQILFRDAIKLANQDETSRLERLVNMCCTQNKHDITAELCKAVNKNLNEEVEVGRLPKAKVEEALVSSVLSKSNNYLEVSYFAAKNPNLFKGRVEAKRIRLASPIDLFRIATDKNSSQLAVVASVDKIVDGCINEHDENCKVLLSKLLENKTSASITKTTIQKTMKKNRTVQKATSASPEIVERVG